MEDLKGQEREGDNGIDISKQRHL